MKISIANKKLEQKPKDNERGKYFNNIKFKCGNFPIEQLQDIISNGYTVTYLFKDNEFSRDNHYMTNNYLGTQFICVDIDSCEINPKEFVEKIHYKPTIYHTTFSNLTQEKGFKYCFHLYYCFDGVIYGEKNFNKVFETLTNDYSEYVDNNARDCHRCIFTSNSTLDNYIFNNSNIIYNVSDFINDESTNYDDLSTFFNENNGCPKIDCLNKSNSLNNLSRKSKIGQLDNINTKQLDNSFELDESFFIDLNSMNRSDFIRKYELEFPYITHTIIDESYFVNGYADVRNINYYVVPSAQYKWNNITKKGEIQKVKNGNRNTMLFIDAIAFMKIIPNITKEYLVYLLVTEVYKNFVNADGQLTNHFIIKKAKEVWESINTLTLEPIKKSFIIDKNYWLQRGKNNWLEVARIIMKEMKSNEFGELYDFNCSVEENIKYFKEYGISTKKQTLIKWLVENNLDYYTDKDYRNKMIMYYHNEDTSRSSRAIEKLMKNDGMKVGKSTISQVIKENSKCPKIDRLNKSHTPNNLSRKSKIGQIECRPTNLCELQKYFISVMKELFKEEKDVEQLEEIRSNLIFKLEEYSEISNYKNIKYIINYKIDKLEEKKQNIYSYEVEHERIY